MLALLRSIIIICAVTAALPAFGANSSVYSHYDLAKCPKLDVGNAAQGDSGSWLCKGYGGFNIYFAEGDLRSFLAFGKTPKNHCAAHQSFSGFNGVNTTVEWRLSKGKPLAAIQRWQVSYDPEDSTKIKSWLVVTKLEANNSCHLALVEGAYPNANAKARELADQMAPTFTCEKSEEKILALPPTKILDIANSGCK